jgi:hypothetical protein
MYYALTLELYLPNRDAKRDRTSDRDAVRKVVISRTGRTGRVRVLRRSDSDLLPSDYILSYYRD